MMRWGMVIDLRRCIGCQTCTIACKLNINVPKGIFFCKVNDYEVGTYPNVIRRFLPTLCMHCKNPPCQDVCPTGATVRRSDGIVVVDYDKCVGCSYCMMACPYGARTFYAKMETYYGSEMTPYDKVVAEKFKPGTVVKCDLCRERVEKGLRRGLKPGVDPEATPICVISCITNARHFGDLDDPMSNVSKLVRERKGYQLHPKLGTDPSVYYIE
ncbi:MAG: 4Fe-4S dicluster domain-containing protein [Candidatus Heimdallarchaeota archaeon]